MSTLSNTYNFCVISIVPFKVFAIGFDAFCHSSRPCIEALCKFFFFDAFVVGHKIGLDVINSFEARSLKYPFQFWKKEEITRG